MPAISDNKRIVKNTFLLYVRMIFIMGVTLFTSRVILDKLGVVDYGLYNAVGGVVGMLSFLNNTLSTGTSRFLTFELGGSNSNKLRQTFSTAFFTHLILAVSVVMLMESIGLWFVYNKLIIPADRLYAALWTYHISVFTTFIAITQVPYTSTIIAHENMKVYAYLGAFEAIAKLFIVYLLVVSSMDKLIIYASLIGGVQLMLILIYRIYCVKHYAEAKLAFSFNHKIFKSMISFSGWGLLANISHMLSSQGLIVLINMFFQPAIVAAQAIGNQLATAMMQFVNNLRTAINPQIIKLYASGDYEASQKLTLQSSVCVFELLLLLGLPAIVVMKPLLNLWLVEVPPYAVIFAQLIILKEILNVYNSSLYIPMIASGRLRTNSFAALCFGIGLFAVLYFLLKMGIGVMWVQYMGLLQIILFGFVVKPYILCKEIGYSWNKILMSFLACVKVAVIPVSVSIVCSIFFDISRISQMFLVVMIICIAVLFSTWMFLDKEMRANLYAFIKTRFNFL